MSEKTKTKSPTIKDKKLLLQAQLPEKIEIFGRAITIVVTNLKGLHGDFNLNNNTIRIHQNSDLETAKATLFHEAVHAALAISGHNEMFKEEQEEALVRMMEHAFSAIVDISKLSVNRVDN